MRAALPPAPAPAPAPAQPPEEEEEAAAGVDDEAGAAGVPTSVLQIHDQLARNVDTQLARSALYRDSGVLIPYAIPKYPRGTDRWALLQWQDQQLEEAASRRADADLDLDCELDMMHFLLKTEITHRGFRALRELHEKYIPVESLDGGLAHPCAALLRLPLTKETLEARTDRRIRKAGRSVFKEAVVPVFCLAREIGGPTTTFRYRDIMEAIVELFGRIDPDTLSFEPKHGPDFDPDDGPAFGHYTTSEQYAYFAKRVREEHPEPDEVYGYCKALVLMFGCDGCASGGLKKIHAVPSLSRIGSLSHSVRVPRGSGACKAVLAGCPRATFLLLAPPLFPRSVTCEL